MDAFGSMGKGGATIDQLAPGVSGALLTTVAALLVAIPTVFIYNSLLSSTRSEITRLENFASLVADRIELDSAN
jgi:biopolymer transport protein TolQ